MYDSRSIKAGEAFEKKENCLYIDQIDGTTVELCPAAAPLGSHVDVGRMVLKAVKILPDGSTVDMGVISSYNRNPIMNFLEKNYYAFLRKLPKRTKK